MKASARATQWGVIFLILGLLLVFISADAGQRFLQRLAYGTPATVCIADVKVELDAQWQIDLLKKAGSSYALVAGVLPLPATMAKFEGADAQVSLKPLGSEGAISIHRVARPESRESLLTKCRTNEHCKVTTSVLDANSDVVEIQAGGATWIQYLDRPVMVDLHGIPASSARGIRLSSCSTGG